MADVVRCSSCGSENEAGRKFCGDCGNALTQTCPSCGTANPPTMKFCGECGSALGAVAASATPALVGPAAERRLVSVLFADLVGFTTLSESRDAEEVRELLSRYFDTCRRLMELYGGTVEKFIGDAVMAVWGTPTATEDDAERAVRAALDLVAAVSTLGNEVGAPELAARAGVLTGEAAVTIGAEGQGMVAGDMVNTAARIQSAAEPGTVLVGESTKRASEASIAYASAGTHALKGKEELVPLWHAQRIVAHRRGERRANTLEAPFVGRDYELRVVKDAYLGTAHDSRATLVTVLGIGGIGKSRLAWELEKHLDGLVENVSWHRGRCLAYGEGVAFWALAEMVRMRAGIAEHEPEESATAKLAEMVRQYVPDHGEREWAEPMLRHLLGLGERLQVERTDLFAAWRLFLERMSETSPVALVFEDLHWGDTALLDFIEHLVEWSRARPIFVLALSRPELLERRGDFGASGRSSTRLALEPLSDDAMNQLLDGLVPGLPDDVRSEIRDRADGIPLYAVETVRMLLDRGALERDGELLRLVGRLDNLDVPETLHALIAARLDGLPSDERRVIEHAAVLGKTFPARGVAALGGVEPDAVEPVLERLVRKELLVLDANPRSPERGQYGFLQALVQRVAYETQSKKERGRLHRLAAVHLENDVGVDPDEISEIIAAHYRDAAQFDPTGESAAGDRASARGWLARAGERAAALGAPEDAQRAFDDAATLTDEPLERAALLERAGELAFLADRMTESQDRLGEAVAIFREAGDTHSAARAAAALGLTLWQLNQLDDALATLTPAFEALSADERDLDVGKLAAEIARIEHFAGNPDAARGYIEIALDVAERHADASLLSQSLNTKSLLLPSTHPHERHALLREALRVAEENDRLEATLRAMNNLIALMGEWDRPDEGWTLTERGLELARARGHRYFATWFGAGLVMHQLGLGEWDDAFVVGEEALGEDVLTTPNGIAAALWLAKASWERGDEARSRAWLERIPQDLAESTDQIRMAQGRFAQALDALLTHRLGDVVDYAQRAYGDMADGTTAVEAMLTFAADGALLFGDRSAAAHLAAVYEGLPEAITTRAIQANGERIVAFKAIADGDEGAAADAFARALAAARSYGRAHTIAAVLADYGTWLVECSRASEAEPLLNEAHALWEHMGGTRWLELIEGARSEIAIRS